ncbi:autotransporter outer membrane beta-barrel domain-containing protein [Bradyrhizobium sp. SYSU BS000235]|uniref:autotransporter outer membrane beta-barrel domain-containing protein n=1 Tax=Bradyrhizobium sp. SYSU BS000235 TaxID=3411332 RepID=UPI003C77B2DE
MARATGGANAVSYRRSLFLTTAIVTLVTAMAGMQPASAQSVTGTGLTYPFTGPANPWSVGGDLKINNDSPGVGGTLNILNGGAVDNATGFIGYDGGSQATVTVSGTDGTHASTWTNNGDLVVGQDGNGTLNILGGGQVTNATGYIGAEFTGIGVNDHSDVIVSGHDASGNASTWTSTSQLNIGDNGKGNLIIQDGGVVNTQANAVIGLDSDGSHNGVGSVLVTGRDINGHASTFNVTGNLTIGGDANDNKLDILNGGVVNSGAATIGDVTFSGSSKGTVTVSGRDANGNASTWNSGNIYVGNSGDGTLNIEDGGAVVSAVGGGSASVYIGYDVGSTGTVTISSTTGNVSSLTVGGSIEVGHDGTGTMTVGNGGFVSVRDDVYIGRDNTGSSGTLHLNGDGTVAGSGVLETGSVIKGFGTTTALDLNGGILRANRNEANFLNGFTALTVTTASFDTNGFDIGIDTKFSGSSTTSFNKLGLGQLTLTGDSSGFAGMSTVSAGTLAVNGVLGGNMLVDTLGRLAGTGIVGNDVINHNVVNKGVVAPGYGGAMGTLTVQGNYAGNGGRLEIATVLGDDSSQTSRLVVNGNTSGSTQVNIINQGGLGAQTVNGIKIVDVVGASSGTFVLNGTYVFQGAPAVIAGAYAYRLYQGGVSTPADGDWYLRSDLLNPPSGPGGPASTPLYQPGVPVYESYGANLQTLNTLPTLQQRVGNRIWGAGSNGDGNGIWGRAENTHGRFNPAVSTTGLDQSIDTWKMQAGADRVFVDNASGRLVAGLNVSYGNANSRINSVFGNGAVKTDGYGLGATLTWYGLTGFYVDGQAQVSRYSSNLNSELRGSLTPDNIGRGEALSIEAGKRIALSDKLGITPQFQVVYSNVRFDRFTDPSGADVAADRNDSFKTRWGVAFDHQSAWEGGRSRIYGIANVSYEWMDGMRTMVSGTPLINADERLWGELGLGASVTWRKNLTLYTEFSGNTPFRGFGNSYILKGNVRLRAQF